MNVSICIATYGELDWSVLAHNRAVPSAEAQGAYEVLVEHDFEGTVASSRNGLVEKATGDWICVLDADDELGPGYLVAMKRAFERGRRDDGHSPLLTPAVSRVVKGRRQSPRLYPVGDLRKNNYLVIGTLVQRDLFMQVGGFSDYPHGFEDWSLWAKCWKAGARVVPVRRAVYIQHVNPDSKHRVAWKDRDWQLEMHKKVERELFGEGV